MTYYSGCDMHKSFSVFAGIDEDGVIHGPTRVDHDTDELRHHLRSLPDGTPVAIETSGRWYWMANEIEEADCIPRLVHARKAKVMMGNTNKTDKLDAEGLAILQKAGTLPDVWIPPEELRDQREVLRLRMKLKQSRTRWKNRIQAILEQYEYRSSYTDPFGPGGREEIEDAIQQCPAETQESLHQQLEVLDRIQTSIDQLEQQLENILEDSPERDWLQTIPGIGSILSATIMFEVGDVSRFPGPGHWAHYAGTTPRIHQSGDTRHTGSMRKQANQTLKWSFMEAAKVVIRHQETFSESRLVEKYQRLKNRKNAGVATGAVARMLAESTYWVLTKEEPYEEP